MGQVMGFDYGVILEMARLQGHDLELTARWLPLADAALRESMPAREDIGTDG